MRGYWLKIVGTALVIFCVGYAGLSVVRFGKHQVQDVVESARDVTIPLPFLPFKFDGTKLGNFRKVVIHRSSPESVTSVDVVVRLSDQAELAKLTGCQLTVDDPTRLNERSTFRCAAADSTMEAFGAVRVQTHSESGWDEVATIPLVLPRDVAKSIRGSDAKSHAAVLEADRFRQIGDSLRILGQLMGKASSDSAREEIRSQMEDLQDEMTELREAIVDAATERAGANVKIGPREVSVEVPAAPDQPGAKVRVGAGGVTVEAPSTTGAKAPAPKAAPQPPKPPR